MDLLQEWIPGGIGAG